MIFCYPVQEQCPRLTHQRQTELTKMPQKSLPLANSYLKAEGKILPGDSSEISQRVTVISSLLSSRVPGKRIGFLGYMPRLSRNKNNGTK